jgi:AcrR family transcriptional regulator
MASNVRTTPRKRPRQRRSKATVDAILEATAQVLVEHGYDKTSTNRVAKRAGVSIGSLYQYFPNKEALVGELVDRYSRRVLETTLATLGAHADAPPSVTGPVLVESMIALKRENPALARVLRDQIPRVGRMQTYETNLETVIGAVATYLERHRDLLRIDDIEAAAFIVVQTVDAATHAGVVGLPGAVDDERLAAHVTDLLLSYLVG